MNYLGIDYGDKHIGVALATGPLASPLATFPTSNATASLKKEIEKHQINKIVVGDCPEEFLTQIRTLGVEVIQTDETLSSHDARQALLHTTQTRRRELEHQASAAVILQTFLDESS